MAEATEQSKRVWRIGHSEYSLGWGGQEMRVFAELKGFRDRGCEVTLIAPPESRIYQRCAGAGISVVELPKNKWALIASVFGLARELRRRRIEVLNTHSSRDGWFVAAAGRLAGTPFIVRSRHVEVTYPNRWISRHAFTTFADYILCTSDRIREHLKMEFGLSDKVIETLPTGIDPDRYCVDGETREELIARKSGGRRLVGMVSVLRSWKGHDVFIAAASELLAEGLDLDFVIAGDGPRRKRIAQWVEESGHRDRFHLLGHCDDVPAVLRSMDVLAIPSLSHEGVPQIGLQALACETPVVGSHIGGIPEIIRDGETGRIVNAGDASDLARGIREALARPEETRKFAEAGRKMIVSGHSCDHMLDRLEEIYRAHCPPSADA